MKKNILTLVFIIICKLSHSQNIIITFDDTFTRHHIHRYYDRSGEMLLFSASWNALINTYLLNASFSNNLSSISSYEVPTNDPRVALSRYYEKIDQLNRTFERQLEANNRYIDQSIRAIGEVAAGLAKQNNITTKNALLDFVIKETVISAVQENTKEKRAQELELKRREIQANLEMELSKNMGEIRDQMIADNTQLRDRYLEAIVYEADYSKEVYFTSYYDYHSCVLEKIQRDYSYRSTNWYKPDCDIPKIHYSTGLNKGDYIDIAFHKLDLYRKYNNELFLKSVNLFLDAGLSQNKQNPKAFILKADLENDIIEKLFFAHLAFSLDPKNTEYKNKYDQINNTFNDDFFQAIRNNNINFISRSIEKGFHLGREKNGKSAVESAIDWDKADILEKFINETPEIKNSLTINGYWLLFHACAVNAIESTKRLISLGINPEYADGNFSGVTALNIAIRNNNDNLVLFLASNYSIAPALMFAKNSGADEFENLSELIYKIVPSKLSEICTINTGFKDKYFIDINIQPNFSDAEVSLNNQRIGLGQVLIKDRYLYEKLNLRVSKPGFITEEKDLILKSGNDLVVKVNLQRNPKPLKSYMVAKDLGYEERTWNFYYKDPEGLKKESNRNRKYNESLRETAKKAAVENAQLYNEKLNRELNKKNEEIRAENNFISNENKNQENDRFVGFQYLKRAVNSFPVDPAMTSDLNKGKPLTAKERSKTDIKNKRISGKADTTIVSKVYSGKNKRNGITIIETPVLPKRTNSNSKVIDSVMIVDENMKFENDYGIFTDIRDRKQYSWVKLNNQIWMSENLAFISERKEGMWIYGSDSISARQTDASSNFRKYGVLYCYNAALKSCPTGWRVPSDLEWSRLENYLDRSISDFNKISYRGTTIGTKIVRNQAESLKAVFGGKRLPNGQFIGIGELGAYWTSSIAAGSNAWVRQVQKNLPQVIRSSSEGNNGYSVRCIKDL